MCVCGLCGLSGALRGIRGLSAMSLSYLSQLSYSADHALLTLADAFQEISLIIQGTLVRSGVVPWRIFQQDSFADLDI